MRPQSQIVLIKFIRVGLRDIVILGRIHCVFDVSVNEKVYDIGFICSDYMAEEAAKNERKYLEDLRRYICDNTQKNIVMLPISMMLLAVAAAGFCLVALNRRKRNRLEK